MQPPPQWLHGAPARSALASLHPQPPTTPTPISALRTCNQTPPQRAGYLVWFLRLRSARPVPPSGGRQGTVQLCYASVDPLRNRRKGLIRTTEGITGDGISSHPDQQLELRFGHLITGAQLTGTDPGEALSDPPTGW